MTTKNLKAKAARRIQRKRRIRKHISGTAAQPRVSIYRSNRYISVQAIDDTEGNTLVAISSKTLGLKANKTDAATLGEAFASTLKGAGIEAIYFDRNGYQYHGVVAAFAEALRVNEIKF